MLAFAGGRTLQGGLQGFSPDAQLFMVLGLELAESELLILDVVLVILLINHVGLNELFQVVLFLSPEAMSLFVKKAVPCGEHLHLGRRVLVHDGRVDAEVGLRLVPSDTM